MSEASGATDTPRISVITASRNVADTITTLYASLLKQRDRNFEWVVADGGSTDGTVELLRQFAERSPWVRFKSEPDGGIYHAINKAIAAAQGEYYVVAGADDSFEPEALENYARLAATGNADVIMAYVYRGNRTIGGFAPDKAWIGASRVFVSSHSVGTLLRKNLHERFGKYSGRLPLLADIYFLKRLLRSGKVRFQQADFIAGRFAEGGATASTNQLQLLAENWQIQMLTERARWLQLLLFVGKLLVRLPSLSTELRNQHSCSNG